MPEFSAEDANKILLALRNGAHRSTAARWVGISEQDMDAWLAEHPSFRRDVETAEAHAEMRLINVIFSKAFTDPKTALAALERRYPGRWGTKAVINVNVRPRISDPRRAIAHRTDDSPRLVERRALRDPRIE